jgi:hypothetical protein
MNVVEGMRVGGAYSATVISSPTPTNAYMIASDVETFVNVGDYIYFNVATKGRVLSVVDYRTFSVDTFVETLPLAGSWKAMAPYSDFGTRKTINAKMIEKQGGEFAYQKYPLIALRLPATISTVGGISTMDANIIIATFTNKQYKPQERLANVFKPVLYPLLYKFLEYVKRTGEFMGYTSDFDHVDRFFYGTESGDESNIANIFADPLDAIELRNFKLTYLVDECP